MPNRRAILIGILCVLSVVSAAYGQAPSDSGVIRVTKDIDVSKLAENVEELNRNVENLGKTIDDLSENVKTLNETVTRLDERTKGIGELSENMKTLNETVTRLDERTKGIANWQYVILGVIGTIFASMVVFFLTQWYSYLRKTNSKSETAPTQVSQANQSTPASANPAQTSEDETAPNPTVPSKFPEGKELEAALQSDSQATREKA